MEMFRSFRGDKHLSSILFKDYGIISCWENPSNRALSSQYNQIKSLKCYLCLDFFVNRFSFIH